jgi:hypothetical protein
MRKKSVSFRPEFADEEIAVLAMNEAEYNKLLCNANPATLHPTWQAYCAFVEERIQKGIARGWPVQVYEGDAIGVTAFILTHNRDLNIAALCAYALYLHGRQMGNTGYIR